MYLDLLKEMNDFNIKELNKPMFHNPLSESAIVKFKKESQMALQYTPCDEYIELLRLTNGFQWTSMLYDTKDFIERNLDHRSICGHSEVIIFGSAGNVSIHTYNTKKKTYNISNMSCNIDEYAEIFKTFGALIVGVFDEEYKIILEGLEEG